MSVRIQPRSWKNVDGSTTHTWRLVIEEWNTDGSRAGSIYPAKDQYYRYGLSPTDTLDEAREKIALLQRVNKHQRIAEKRAKIEKRLDKEDAKESKFLPANTYERFLEWLLGRRGWDQIPDKTESHLRCMRRLILDVNIDPSTWAIQSARIYTWFVKAGLSVSYLEKVLPLLNEYGYFYSQEFKKAFLQVDPPPSLFREKINDANADRRDGATNESLPLAPEHFEKLGHYAPEQLRWLRYSLYLGLRPEETDHMTLADRKAEGRSRKGRWWVYTDAHETPILVVYQPKLVKLPWERRWKRIPIILPEQEYLLMELIAGEPIKRPTGRYLQKNLGDKYTLYAGRKGFKQLMRAAGQSEFNIHRWQGKRDFRELDNDMRESEQSPFSHKAISQSLGHTSMTRTERNYEAVDAVEYQRIKG